MLLLYLLIEENHELCKLEILFFCCDNFLVITLSALKSIVALVEWKIPFGHIFSSFLYACIGDNKMVLYY